MALRAVIDHPKFNRFKQLIGANRALAMGYLECLWHFTGRFAPQGDVGRFSDEEIEAWVEWDGEPGALIEALVKSKWLDHSDAHRLLVHDWHQHADDATRMSLKRKKLSLISPESDEITDDVPAESLPCPDSVATVSLQSSDGVGTTRERNGTERNGTEKKAPPTPSPAKSPGIPIPECLQLAGFEEVWTRYLTMRRENAMPMGVPVLENLLRDLKARPDEASAYLQWAIERKFRGVKWDYFDERAKAQAEKPPTPEKRYPRSSELEEVM